MLDTWNSPYLEDRLWPQFSEDTWTWDLVRGLQSSMGDVDHDVVYRTRKDRAAQSWDVRVQSVRPPDGHEYAAFHDSDSDL